MPSPCCGGRCACQPIPTSRAPLGITFWGSRGRRRHRPRWFLFFAQYIGFATFPKVAQLEKWGPLLLRPAGHSAILVIAARASPLPTLRLAAALNIWVARGGARFAQKRKRRLGELPSVFSRFSESRFWANVKPTAAKCRLRDPLSRSAPARFAAIRPSRCGGLRSRKQLHRRNKLRACVLHSNVS